MSVPSPKCEPTPDGFYWTDNATNIQVEQDTDFCPDDLCNAFSARISNRTTNWSAWAGETCDGEGPVVIFVPSDGGSTYFSEVEIDKDDDPENDDPPEGIRTLQTQLFEAGARILEIRWKCPMLNPGVAFYSDTHACQHTLLNSALNVLVGRLITEHPSSGPVPTNETWWPEHAACRFAYGVSEGETQLQFAVEVADDDVGIMNRVVYGGGGLPLDMRGTLDCNDTGDDSLEGCSGDLNDACKHLEFTNFLFGDLDDNVPDACGACLEGCIQNPPSCPNNQSCADTPATPIQEALDEASIKSHIGPNGDDHSRIIGAVIVNTGLDVGQNEEANSEYLDLRDSVLNDVDTSKERLWQWTHCVCGCPFWGHGTLNRTYEMFKDTLDPSDTPIDDWTDFFVNGNLVFDLYSLADDFPELICPAEPEDYCDIVAPPEEAEHAPMDCEP